MTTSWQKVQLQRDNGEWVDMQCPVIVSASRSTDIPAFYADWFFHRLKKGYSAWTNPFNGVDSYISYSKTRFIVFWSKNPRPLLKHFDYLRAHGIGCYIQYTLNDYEVERLECGVPPLDYRIDTFKMLVDKLGFGSVIWRFDPMIMTDNISINNLLSKVSHIGDQLKGYTEKLVFSYADIASYRKVKANLDKNTIHYVEWDDIHMLEFANELSSMNRFKGWNFKLATCSEKIELNKYGIEHNRCIDEDLIVKLAYDDKELMDFLNVDIKPKEQSLFEPFILPDRAIDLSSHFYAAKRKDNKDKGQRLFCGCMVSKDIGQYNTCPHLCEYCYANTSKHLAVQNWKKHLNNPYGEHITG